MIQELTKQELRRRNRDLHDALTETRAALIEHQRYAAAREHLLTAALVELAHDGKLILPKDHVIAANANYRVSVHEGVATIRVDVEEK